MGASPMPTKPAKMEDTTFGELKGDRQPSQRCQASMQIECRPPVGLKDSEPDWSGKLAGGASQRCNIRREEGAGRQLSQRSSFR
jgi:ABC-type nitrate/sulfonate/bicarbonate transport system ATPase subunit